MTGFQIIYTGAPPQDPKSMHGLAEDNRKAREAGLTYGQWAAMQAQEAARLTRKRTCVICGGEIGAESPRADTCCYYCYDIKRRRKQCGEARKESVKFDLKLFVGMYNKGHSDFEIAKKMGVTAQTILKYRKHVYGLPSNRARYVNTPIQNPRVTVRELRARKKKGGKDEQAGNVPQKLRHDATADGREIAGR